MGQHKQNLRRRGVAIIYVVICMIATMGLVSLAVDLGRVETAKTELRRAADAAARVGAAYLPQGTSAVQTAAIAMAANDTVDGTAVSITSSNVTVGIWNTSKNKFSSSGTADNVTKFQAVQVTINRANGNAIPLLFGSLVGASTCSVSATSVAALISQSTSTQWVPAHGNPWLAGEPAGTLGSVPDTGYGYTNKTTNNTHPWEYDVANPAKVAAAVAAAGGSGNYTVPTDKSQVETTDYSNGEPYGSPSEFQLAVSPGSIVQISIPVDSSDTDSNEGFLTNGSGSYYADGTGNGSVTYYSDDAANPTDSQGTQTTSGSEHGISNIIAPLNSAIGVFLDKTGSTTGADSETAPAGTDYSVQANANYTTASPKLNQTFYVGTGQTSSGVQQSIVVPNNAYALFLGTMDGHEWSNNVGGFTATITQYSIEIVH